MISEYYKQLNKELHETEVFYGSSGYKFQDQIKEISESCKSRDILDYGCGKGTLSASLGWDIQQYDPAIKKFSQRPKPADIVVCTDVMEHIEPEFIEDVIKDLHDLTKKILFVSIANRPAKKVLKDGRNAHLTQEDYRWWMPKFWGLFQLFIFRNYSDLEYIMVFKKND